MISVIVPTRNSSRDLEACLASLRDQEKKPGEIIVVFDSKRDKNLGILKKFGAITLFDENHTIGGAYNTGAAASKHGIVAFLDDDCTAPRDWIKKMEREFKERIDVVGGEDLLPEGSSFFQEAAYQIDKARMLKKPIYGTAAKMRLRGANIAYRKSVFEENNFNPRLKGLQEPEFHHRLFAQGYKMKFDPNVFVYHKRRNSLKSIFFQIYRNGKAKINLLKIHRDMVSPIDILPVAYLAATIALVYLRDWLLLYVWLSATLVYFLGKPMAIVSRSGGWKFYPLLAAIVFVRETAYALGILAGIAAAFKR